MPTIETSKTYDWIEIVKLRMDRRVKYLRLPAAWCRANGILPGEYFTVRSDGDGGLHIRPLSKELDYAQNAAKYPFKSDRSRRVSDAGPAGR